MVHAILIIIEAARIIIPRKYGLQPLGVPAFKACACLPVDKHAAKIKDHIGDVGTGEVMKILPAKYGLATLV